MDLILPLLITIAAGIIKWTADRYGSERGILMVKVFVLIASGAIAWVITAGLITPEFLHQLGLIMAKAVGIYEIGWKWILSPAIETAKEKFSSEN